MYQPRVNCVSKNSITNKYACFNYCIFGAYAGGRFGDAAYYIIEIQNKKSPVITELFCLVMRIKIPINVLGGIRTPDRWLRRPLLYPAELPGHV